MYIIIDNIVVVTDVEHLYADMIHNDVIMYAYNDVVPLHLVNRHYTYYESIYTYIGDSKYNIANVIDVLTEKGVICIDENDQYDWVSEVFKFLHHPNTWYNIKKGNTYKTLDSDNNVIICVANRDMMFLYEPSDTTIDYLSELEDSYNVYGDGIYSPYDDIVYL